MTFTALHRALGVEPGPLTDELLDTAVRTGVVEMNDLDWKSKLPPAKALPETDFPKDVAAMANSGGGVIVYGVLESQKAATGRVDAGPLDEVHERAMRSVAITAISPPVFGLNVHHFGADENRAVIVEVPASVDGPHLIYRGEYFGAPVRNDADTGDLTRPDTVAAALDSSAARASSSARPRITCWRRRSSPRLGAGRRRGLGVPAVRSQAFSPESASRAHVFWRAAYSYAGHRPGAIHRLRAAVTDVMARDHALVVSAL